ncbi:MAG: gliding motility-associated ABC transporter permease subunit GldF, partial [Bacteroidota bacterium]
QIVAFITAVFLCFVLYFGFEGLAGFAGSSGSIVSMLGMDYHFKSMSRGVLDTRNIIYFVSVTALFLSLTVYKLKTLRA